MQWIIMNGMRRAACLCKKFSAVAWLTDVRARLNLRMEWVKGNGRSFVERCERPKSADSAFGIMAGPILYIYLTQTAKSSWVLPDLPVTRITELLIEN